MNNQEGFSDPEGRMTKCEKSKKAEIQINPYHSKDGNDRGLGIYLTLDGYQTL